jgi:hypothetical protein
MAGGHGASLEQQGAVMERILLTIPHIPSQPSQESTGEGGAERREREKGRQARTRER